MAVDRRYATVETGVRSGWNKEFSGRARTIDALEARLLSMVS